MANYVQMRYNIMYNNYKANNKRDVASMTNIGGDKLETIGIMKIFQSINISNSFFQSINIRNIFLKFILPTRTV